LNLVLHFFLKSLDDQRIFNNIVGPELLGIFLTYVNMNDVLFLGAEIDHDTLEVLECDLLQEFFSVLNEQNVQIRDD